MTASNHALTGAIIGLTIHQPLIALPVALLSHYVLDAIPHLGGFLKINSLSFRKYLLFEATMCFILVLALAIFRPNYWPLAALCAFTAASPDFMWIKKFRQAQAGKSVSRSKIWFVKLHSKIQWFERPIGLVTELAWLAGGLVILVTLIKL